MRICIKTDFWSYTSETIQWKSLAREWLKGGHRVEFLDTVRNNIPRADRNQVKKNNVDLLDFVRTSYDINKNPDVYIDHSDFASFSEKIPISCKIRSSIFCWGLTPINVVLLKKISNYISPLFLPSSIMYNEVKNEIQDVYFFDPAVDLSIFNTAQKPNPIAGNYKTKFLWVGRSVSASCPDILLESYYELFNRSDNVLLIMISLTDRTERLAGEIRSRIDKEDFPEVLFVKGGIDPICVSSYMLHSTALINPVRFHCRCKPVLEAMACGKLVVTTNYGGPSDYSNNSSALYVDYLFENAMESSKELTRYRNMEGILFCSMFQGDSPFVWAKPSKTHLKEIMQKIHTRSFNMGQFEASAYSMARRYTWNKVADYMIHVFEKTLKRR